MLEPHCFEATLVENRPLGGHAFLLRLDGCAALEAARPGQFVMVRGSDWGSDPLLPRAFSLLAAHADGSAELLVKAVGKATGRMERSGPGTRFRLLGPLGNWFPEPTRERSDWLIAGGVGLAPLLMHAACARATDGAVPMVFYGGRSKRDLVLVDELTATGAKVVLATEDGSAGERGFVTAAVERALREEERAAAPGAWPPTLLACGPEPMLTAVARIAHRQGLDAYLSLEGEMACGLGACLACAVPGVSRPFRYACSDGPVFPLAELAGPYAPAESEEGAAR